MKIHHLNCGCMCPTGSRWFPKAIPSLIVCHCLLIETSDKLILVDTGLGKKELENPKRLGLTGELLGINAELSITAAEQVQKLGFSPNDVTDIIPTHLDMDHAGGIPDFKNATTHISYRELSEAYNQNTHRAKMRYGALNFSKETRWSPFRDNFGEKWNGFDCVRELAKLPPEILLINLPGHSIGHFGVAVQNGEQWLLHAGDAYYDRREVIDAENYPLGIRLTRKLIHEDNEKAQQTLGKIRNLNSKSNIEYFSSHDPKELPKDTYSNSLFV